MRVGIKKIFSFIILSFLTIACITLVPKKVEAGDTTNRNEQFPAEEYKIPITNISSESGYGKIYENNNFEYYFSPTKMILKILNKKTGFVWSTGAGTLTEEEQEENCRNITINSEKYQTCGIDVLPGSGSARAHAQVNQLLYITWFKNKKNESVFLESSKISLSQFLQHKDDPSQWILKLQIIDGKNFELGINVRFSFDEDGFSVKVLDSEITGANRDMVSAIYLLPNLGQSGGKIRPCTLVNVDENGYGDCTWSDEEINNPRTNLPGYIFIPDGSGALIRFDDIKYYNSTYYFDVYGDPFRKTDYTVAEWSDNIYIQEKDMVPLKQIMMPVWGVAYGNNQDAFVAYVKQGAEYLGIEFEGRSTGSAGFEYSKVKPRFERNRKYNYYIDGRAQDQILTADENYDYDIEVKYDFLHGDGSDGTAPANYIGMALKYRDYIVSEGLVKTNVTIKNGPRVDFLVCDVKNGLFGYSEVIGADTDDIKNIFNDLNSNNVKNINSSLFGWQDGGVSTSNPGKADFNSNAGGKKGFQSVVDLAETLGYDISFQTQYGMINGAQFNAVGAYCVKALSRDYSSFVVSDMTKPITWWHYTNPNVAMSWLNDQADVLTTLGDVGITINGVSTNLTPDYEKKIDYAMSANIATNGTAKASQKVTLGADNPNFYLWKNLDNFYDIPVYNSQYLAETDSVPFLEIVLSGLVNLYAPYANLSFYDTKAMLKMVEYNLNPSFMITAESNIDLNYTNSRDYFSTSYADYRDLIIEMNEKVVSILNAVQGKTIVNRIVVEDETDGELGLYINEYAVYENGKIDDSTRVKVAINYLDRAITYKGVVIQPLSAMILEGV